MASIFDFENYRSFLKAHLQELPNRGHGEARRIALHLDVSSTFISQVLSGSRQLTPEQGMRLAEYLGLSKLESDGLFYFVQLERAGSETLQKYLREKFQLLKLESSKLVNRVEAKRILSDTEKSIFYSSSIYSAVQLFAATGNKGRTVEDVIERFNLTRAKALEIIGFLKDCGLLQERAGRFQLGVQSTHVPQGSPHLLRHHANWRIKAMQAAEALDESELMYTSQVSLSEKDFTRLRGELLQFIKNFLDTVHASPADEIANLNIDWFRVRN